MPQVVLEDQLCHGLCALQLTTCALPLAHHTVFPNNSKVVMALGNVAGLHEQLLDYEEAESMLTVTRPVFPPFYPPLSSSSCSSPLDPLAPCEDPQTDMHTAEQSVLHEDDKVPPRCVANQPNPEMPEQTMTPLWTSSVRRRGRHHQREPCTPRA